jgi:cell division protein FtsB
MFDWIRRIPLNSKGLAPEAVQSSGKQRPPGLVALLVVLVVMAVVVFGDRGLWDLVSLHQERGDLTREVERLHSDIHALQVEYKEYGANSAAVERAAREELNLVKPGETVYKFGTARR